MDIIYFLLTWRIMCHWQVETSHVKAELQLHLGLVLSPTLMSWPVEEEAAAAAGCLADTAWENMEIVTSLDRHPLNLHEML